MPHGNSNQSIIKKQYLYGIIRLPDFKLWKFGISAEDNGNYKRVKDQVKELNHEWKDQPYRFKFFIILEGVIGKDTIRAVEKAFYKIFRTFTDESFPGEMNPPPPFNDDDLKDEND